MRRFLLGAVGFVVLVAAVAWFSRGYLILHVPGWLAEWRDPIAANHPVTWESGPDAARSGPRPPNIVVIVADDLGYNDLTFAGGGVANGAVPTPNIDSLARDGVTFTHGYTGNATCAPSRAAIMTGRFPTRFGFEFTPAPKPFMKLIARFQRDNEQLHTAVYYADREKDVPSMDQEGIPASETTLAELLKTRGYRTLGLGKWHLGEAPALRPTARGFDEYLGFYAGAQMYLRENDPNAVNSKQDFDPIDRFLWANLPFAVTEDGGPRFRPDTYMTDYLSREACRAIEANKNRPFFLYLAYNAPHTPLQASKADYDALPQIQDHRLRVYAAMIRALDRGVGQVLDALRANGLENDTLVLFASDNGGANYIGLPDINQPFRGWKMTFFEGGVRTPFFAKWPARLGAGVKYSPPVGHVDIFATAAGAAGAPLPAGRTYDGVDLVARVRAQAPESARPLYWRSGSYKGVLAGGWKLQVAEHPEKVWLFDLGADPTERTNLAEARPEKLAEMRTALAALDGQMVPSAWPSLIEGPIAIDHPLPIPDKPDDEYVYWAN